jgi:Tol biopolymer transport system component
MKTIIQGCAILMASVCFSGLLVADESEVPTSIPDWEVHLFDLVESDKGYQIENGSNISSSKGYDNQPYFTPGGESILFTSDRGGSQTDIYEYFISSRKTVQVTDTKSSEYTPKTSPDNQIITFVRDGEGANPDQTVWQMNRKTAEYSWAINSMEPVGYYHFNHETGNVFIWSRYGFSVSNLNSKQNLDTYVSGNAVPATPKQVPDTNLFSFVHRQMNGEIWIKSFNPETHAITPIAPTQGANSDYAWAPNGDLFRAEDNVLYVWKKNETSRQWTKVQDMSGLFNGTISRLAISPDGNKIALVENP